MKIALIITGQLRTYKLCGEIIKNTIIDRYDTDVFLSINKVNKLQYENLNNANDSSESDIQDAVDFYKPKDVAICNDYENVYSELTVNKDYKENRLILEQYYIVKQGYQLLINYINTHQTKYDAIIRVRFDQFIWSSTSSVLSNFVNTNSFGHRRIFYNTENIIKVRDLCKELTTEIDHPASNEIYVYGKGDTHNSNYKWVNDQFWVHSMDTIDIIANFYDNIIPIINEVLPLNLNPTNCAYFELILWVFFKNNGIHIEKSRVIGEFCNEFIL
jgi:hypothetical protein